MRPRLGFTLIELLVVVAIIAILAAIAIPNFLEAQTRAKVSRVKSDMRTICLAVESYGVDHNAYPRMNPNASISGKGGLLLFAYDNFLYYEGGYEPDMGPGGGCPTSLTTPVAYLTSHPPLDPFIGHLPLDKTGVSRWTFERKHCSYFFYNFKGAARHRLNGWNPEYAPVISPAPLRLNGPQGPIVYAAWALLSPGPDKSFAVKNPEGSDPWVSYQFFFTPQDWQGMQEGCTALYDPTNGAISQGDIWRTNQGQL